MSTHEDRVTAVKKWVSHTEHVRDRSVEEMLGIPASAKLSKGMYISSVVHIALLLLLSVVPWALGWGTPPATEDGQETVAAQGEEPAADDKAATDEQKATPDSPEVEPEAGVETDETDFEREAMTGGDAPETVGEAEELLGINEVADPDEAEDELGADDLLDLSE
jgi:hypothetical protein